MTKVTAIGFVVPALDLHNAGANVAGEECDEFGNVAVVGACAARAVESKGDGICGVAQLQPHATGAVKGMGGIKGDRASRKHTRTDN
jgi:hypothetical protein